MGSVGSSSPLTGSRSSNGYSAGFSRGSSQRRAASVGAQFMVINDDVVLQIT